MPTSRDAQRLLLVSAHDAERAQRALRKLARRVKRRREDKRASADGLQRWRELQAQGASR